MRHWIIAGLIVIHAPWFVTGAEMYVAPTGDDMNPGTADRPFATLARAQEAVRERNRRGLDEDVVVWIAEGRYALTQPLVFGPDDGGTERFAVTYASRPGHAVILSGGEIVTGWTQSRGQGNVWIAVVPREKGVPSTPRNLFVGHRRAVRARTPNVDAEPNCVQLQTAMLSEDLGRFTLTLPEGILQRWRRPSEIEVMIAGNWAINRKRVQSIDAEAGILSLAPPHRRGPHYIFPRTGRWCYLENAREMLDQPGEWYYDAENGTLTYWARADQSLATVPVTLPRLRQLLIVRGTPDRPVRNLHFKGLRLMHTDWQLPPEGYMGIQACHYGRSSEPGRRWQRIPAAVVFQDADGCSVEDGVVAHLGGSGIELADGCRNCSVQGNHVFDVGGNGVMVGGPNIEPRVPRSNRVINNHVHACGRDFYGAVGIWIGFAQKTRVAHNLVHDLPYTGISVGWQWNPAPSASKENQIEFNHVYDVMNRLCDGGCIYTLGYQPGTVIRGNHLHGVHRSPMAQGAPNNGMFIDQGSKGYRFEQNVIYETHAAPIRFNQCQRDWHTWRDNYIGPKREAIEAGKHIIAKAGLEHPVPAARMQ